MGDPDPSLFERRNPVRLFSGLDRSEVRPLASTIRTVALVGVLLFVLACCCGMK